MIGAGYGSLLTFLCNIVPSVRVAGIEMDKEVLEIAHNYFGFPKHNANEWLSMRVGHGLSLMSEISNNNEASNDNESKIVLQ